MFSATMKAEGVRIEQGYSFDTYRGNRDALIASGVALAEWFPASPVSFCKRSAARPPRNRSRRRRKGFATA